jgi:hypothetical protein
MEKERVELNLAGSLSTVDRKYGKDILLEYANSLSKYQLLSGLRFSAGVSDEKDLLVRLRQRLVKISIEEGEDRYLGRALTFLNGIEQELSKRE